MNDIENEISQITHTNTLLRNQNDQISKEFNQMKKNMKQRPPKLVKLKNKSKNWKKKYSL